jgi:hypothetical protein
MPSPHAILRLVSALGGLAMAGCCSPYPQAPYNPYGSGIPTYPQAIPVQPQFGPTPVNPNGTFPPSNNFGGSQFNDGSGLSPTPDPGSGGSFPPSGGSGNYDFNPNLPNSGGGLVPNYGDPGDLPAPNGTFEGGDRALGRDGASFQRDNPSQSVGSVRFDRDAGTRELQLTAHQPAPLETRPVVMASYPEAESAASKKPNPYGYDAVGYRWLRGLVDFDEQQKAWVLIYNPSPGPRDLYKGQITLIDNGQLRNLKNNDVVLVEGQIDSTSRDADTGKPQYRITKLYGPLVPKS